MLGLVIPLWKRKGEQEGQEYLERYYPFFRSDLSFWRGWWLRRLRSWFDGHLGLHQFGFSEGERVLMMPLQISRRLVEEVATSTDGGRGDRIVFSRHREGIP